MKKNIGRSALGQAVRIHAGKISEIYLEQIRKDEIIIQKNNIKIPGVSPGIFFAKAINYTGIYLLITFP